MTAVYTAANPRSKLMRWSVPQAQLHHEPTNKYNQSRIYIQMGFFPLFTPIRCPPARPVHEQMYSLYTPILYLSSDCLLIVSFFPATSKEISPFISLVDMEGMFSRPRVCHHFLAGEIMTIDTVTSLHASRCLLGTISASARHWKVDYACV